MKSKAIRVREQLRTCYCIAFLAIHLSIWQLVMTLIYRLFIKVLLTIFGLLLSGCSSADSDPNTEAAFRALCNFDMPDSVRDVECHGGHWQDFSFAIRFQANDSVIKQVVSSGFKRVDSSATEAVEETFAEFRYVEYFENPWPAHIASIGPSYVRNVSTPDVYENYALVVDEKNNTVYAIGEVRSLLGLGKAKGAEHGGHAP